MAEQQGRYLARCLNDEAKAGDAGSVQLKPFVYKQLGAMASVGARLENVRVWSIISPRTSSAVVRHAAAGIFLVCNTQNGRTC